MYPLLKAFSDYQIQQMTANFVDQFGFNDEEFTDAEDRIAYVIILILDDHSLTEMAGTVA